MNSLERALAKLKLMGYVISNERHTPDDVLWIDVLKDTRHLLSFKVHDNKVTSVVLAFLYGVECDELDLLIAEQKFIKKILKGFK